MLSILVCLTHTIDAIGADRANGASARAREHRLPCRLKAPPGNYRKRNRVRVSKKRQLCQRAIIRSRPMASSPAVETSTNSLKEYAAESARPLVSMVFIAPLLIVYEFGVVLLGPHALRNGADSWLRYSLEYIGFGQYFLLPILTCGILLAWHHTRRDAWSLQSTVLTTMLLESMLFALILFGLAHVQRTLFGCVANTLSCASVSGTTQSPMSRMVGYCGAGIYEELLFRLIMLSAIAGVLRWAGFPGRASWLWAIIASSLVFSAAHYQLFRVGGYAFDWYSFSFRFTAGTFFAILFVTRGFGIAAGAHALYDILVEIT